MEDVREIRRIVAAINDAWRGGNYDAIGQYVADHVVMAPPGQDARVMGRAAYVASFRQYSEVANTTQFSPGTPRVDVIDDTAVAVCPFGIVYEIEGTTYSEKGFDILVFARTGDGWKIVWRTLTSEPQELPA
ncbi:MAG TPA: nuclear transport factor 2 family protein [Vicinamibacterales bacterium]|jgi:ketosteroid isomerase-like protein|nr:nuclear transport factor 2 family protein [Vicinamibacterales bacterium]